MDNFEKYKDYIQLNIINHIERLMGNEVKGVHQEVIDASNGCLEIPQYGTKHSMNVSVTAGIVIWHFVNSQL